MNFADLFISLIVGLALPLAILDGLRGLVQVELPRQEEGFQFEPRLAPWLLALIAGPGLLAESLIARARSGNAAAAVLLPGSVIMVLWAILLGYVVLWCVRTLTVLP